MKLLLTVLFPCILAASGSAATIYVPDDRPTIQRAINAAMKGDTIIVRPGTYVENVHFIGKAITVRSEHGSAVTVIDGNRSGSVVSFTNQETTATVLDGFSLRNGSGTPNPFWLAGGGIFCQASSPTIINNLITGNTAEEYGGGIYCGYSSDPVIAHNTIELNTGHGGGICSEYGSAPQITRNTIARNEGWTKGGGILCITCFSIVSDNEITENHADDGGGICCRSGSLAVITGNRIVGNTGQRKGGGIKCDRASPTISGNWIESNRSDSSGAGICCEDDAGPIIWNNDIVRNDTRCGGGIACEKGSSPFISENRIRDNEAGQDGGGIRIFANSAPTVLHNVITGNRARQNGGALECWKSDAFIIGNVVASNDATMNGGGICCRETLATIINTAIYQNSAVSYDGGGIFSDSTSVVTVTNSILWGNKAVNGPQVHGSATVTYSDIQGGCPGLQNIDADPLFVNPSSHDFHIIWNSPCRNGGDNSVVTQQYDFEDDPRVVQGTVDIGVDEYHHHLYAIGHMVPGTTVNMSVVGLPGSPARLGSSASVQYPPYPTPHGYCWLPLSGLKRWNLSTIPSTGVLSICTTVPVTWQPGERRLFQALIGTWGNPATRFTNLMTLEVK